MLMPARVSTVSVARPRIPPNIAIRMGAPVAPPIIDAAPTATRNTPRSVVFMSLTVARDRRSASRPVSVRVARDHRVMRLWTVAITRPLSPEDIERARAVARYRWGSSADVTGYDRGVLTFLAPDADWIGPEFRLAVERGDGVEVAPGRRSTRGKRRR